jgi:hypothetical protein
LHRGHATFLKVYHVTIYLVIVKPVTFEEERRASTGEYGMIVIPWREGGWD